MPLIVSWSGTMRPAMSPARELGRPFTSSVLAPDAVLYVPHVDTHTVAVVAS